VFSNLQPGASRFPSANLQSMAREKRLFVQRIEQKARTSTAIKAAINSDETVAAIVFALGLSFHDRRP